MEFIPAFSDYEKKVTASFDRQGFMKHIRATLSKVSPGFCEISVPYNENLSQQHGFFHAGVVGTIADNVAGYAAFSLMSENSSIVTVEYKLNLLAPAKGDLLIGKGQVLKKGKTLTICRADIYIESKGVLKLCGASQATLFELRNSEDKKA